MDKKGGQDMHMDGKTRKGGGHTDNVGYPELDVTENDIIRVVKLIDDQPELRLTDEQREMLQDAKIPVFDDYFSIWNEQIQANHSEDEEERVNDFDENHRLQKVWHERSPWTNWILAISFHLFVLVNFSFCLWESFGILAENSKFELLYLKDVYQCLRIVPSADPAAHFVSIIHATTCVAVLHAKTLKTANLCWAFLFGTVLHNCYKMYEILFTERFEVADSSGALAINGTQTKILKQKSITIVVFMIVQLLAVIIILQRYYDLTARFQKRAHKFVTQTYEGRQLNDRIIYRNVSSFVQRKYVLRSCTALQIYNTVQRMQQHRKGLKKGEDIDEEVFRKDVRAAVQALKEVEGYHGMDMMRELKRRNYEHLKEEFEAGGEAEELETELVTLGEIDVLQNLEIIEDEITGTDPSPV